MQIKESNITESYILSIIPRRVQCCFLRQIIKENWRKIGFIAGKGKESFANARRTSILHASDKRFRGCCIRTLQTTFGIVLFVRFTRDILPAVQWPVNNREEIAWQTRLWSSFCRREQQRRRCFSSSLSGQFVRHFIYDLERGESPRRWRSSISSSLRGGEKWVFNVRKGEKIGIRKFGINFILHGMAIYIS